MSLNIPSANSYNRAQNYTPEAIRIIQREVGTATTGSFNDQTATRIYDWQRAPNRMRSLTPDGKMGPVSLGTMIAELNRSGRSADALALSRFPNVLPPGAAPPAGADINPIVEFRAITLTPIDLRASGAGFKMGGRFKIQLRLNPSSDCSRYQYRQFIKGSVSLQQGRFIGTPHTLANWRATGALHNAMHDFRVPGGLQPHFTEDGEMRHGRAHHFGHRSAAPVNEPGLEDRYLPTQASGCEYRGMDTYGLEGRSRPVGLRIKMKITWQGRVIDTANSNRIIDTRHWGVDRDDVIV